MLELLDKHEVYNYLYNHQLPEKNQIEIIDILSEVSETEGLVNRIYQISEKHSGNSFVIKQVLPYALGIAQFTGEYHEMDKGRIITESRALDFLDAFWSGIVPKLFKTDRENSVLIMEDLSDYRNLRFELPKAKRYPYFGIEIGSLLAGLRYYTSDLYLDQKHCAKLKNYFQNDVHRVRMADMIMSEDNMTRHPEKFERSVKEACKAVGNDEVVQREIKKLRDELVYHPYCFCHMDLHIGNILVHGEEIKLIDSEFSGYGTSYMDLGRIAGSFLIDYFYWLESEGEKREEMLAYNKQMIFDLFTAYKLTLESLLPQSYQEIYQEEEQKSIRLMLLSTLLRMQKGVALSYDLSLLPKDKLASAEQKAFELTKEVFSDSEKSKLEVMLEWFKSVEKS